MRISLFSFILFACSQPSKEISNWISIESGHHSSVRAIDIVDDNVFWFSGSQGIVGVSTDGGKSLRIDSIADSRGVDFRDIHAFDHQTVIIMGAGNGSDSKLLLTEDGGKSWHIILQNTDSAAFFDGIAFWDRQSGILLGDPVHGKAYLRISEDGGKTWMEPPSLPPFLEGEYAFAASGSSIITQGDSTVFIVSGGKYARVFMSKNRSRTWSLIGPSDFIAGSSSQGIFSVDVNDDFLSIVGGDYLNDSLKNNNNYFSSDAGNNWQVPMNSITGYQSCVKINPVNDLLISLGTSGSYISRNQGKTWNKFSEEKLHVLDFSPSGKMAVAAGSKGLMFKMMLQ